MFESALEEEVSQVEKYGTSILNRGNVTAKAWRNEKERHLSGAARRLEWLEWRPEWRVVAAGEAGRVGRG